MTREETTQSAQRSLLKVEGLRKTYRTGRVLIEVLQDLELSVRRGEMVAVVGESGVGKTTLLHLLGLMDRPDAGRYRFEDEDVLRLGEDERAEFRNRRCGFVFQAHHLLPEFSALENAAMPLWIRGVSAHEAEGRARGLLDRLGLADRSAHRPPQLSGGERQRVAIARAFVGDPDLILADEPTGDLDPDTAEGVFGLFRQVHRDSGVSTVLVTHNGELASRCDRVLEVHEGRLRPR